MRKIILLFFVLITNTLFARNIIIISDYFSQDRELMEYIQNKAENIKTLPRKINKYFWRKGYIFTKVKQIIISKEKDSITIYLDEGRIRLFWIIGAHRVSYQLINTYLAFKEGDIFNLDRLRMQMKKLYKTGLFDTIQYKTIISEKSILIRIVEKRRTYFKISGKYSTLYGIKPCLGFINRNVMHSEIFMDINAEIGFWDRWNYLKLNMNGVYKNYYLNTGYKGGRTFIYENDYSSLEEKIHPGINIYSSRNYNMFLFLLLEHYYFYNTGYFSPIYNGLRYGLSMVFTFDNKREVLALREESWYNINCSMLFFNNSMNYFKFNFLSQSYLGLFSGFGLVYKNSSAYISGTVPFDQMILLGGIHQRGYREGSYSTDLAFSNGLEIENEVILNRLRLILFEDITIYREANYQYKLILSYGPGLVVNILNFNIETYYGVPLNANITQGLFYVKLKKMI